VDEDDVPPPVVDSYMQTAETNYLQVFEKGDMNDSCDANSQAGSEKKS